MGPTVTLTIPDDGELVYSKPETGEVLELFTELMGSDVPRYGEE